VCEYALAESGILFLLLCASNALYRLNRNSRSMFDSMTKKLAVLGALAVVLVLGAGPVALACSSQPATPTLATTIQCTTDSLFSACSSTSPLPGGITGIEDSAVLTLNEKTYGCDEWSYFGSGFGTSSWFGNGGDKGDSCNYGTISFYLVSGTETTCPTTAPTDATAEGSNSVSGSGTFTSNPTSTLSPGSYYYYVVYTGTGKSDGSGHGTWNTQYGEQPGDWNYYYKSVVECEPFTVGTPGFPPPSSVPQFPLGVTLVLAFAIPGLLLLRGKFTSRHPSYAA